MVIPKILLIWMFFIFKIYTYYVHRYIRVHNNSIYAHLSFKIQNSVFFMCKLWHVSVIKVFLITADNVVILNRIYWILPTFLYFLLNFNITLLNMFFFLIGYFVLLDIGTLFKRDFCLQCLQKQLAIYLQ